MTISLILTIYLGHFSGLFCVPFAGSVNYGYTVPKISDLYQTRSRFYIEIISECINGWDMSFWFFIIVPKNIFLKIHWIFDEKVLQNIPIGNIVSIHNWKSQHMACRMLSLQLKKGRNFEVLFVAKSSTRTVEVRCKNSLTKRLQRTCGNTACSKSTCHRDLERQISGRKPVLCYNILDINDLWKPFKWIYYQNISKLQMESLQCS